MSRSVLAVGTALVDAAREVLLEQVPLGVVLAVVVFAAYRRHLRPRVPEFRSGAFLT